jgi:aminobenzoyl-glutamate transport protein
MDDQTTATPPASRSLLLRCLDGIEYLGNKLPHPATLFAIFALGVILLSALFSALDLSATHPATGEEIRSVNLLSGEGLRMIVDKLVTNFTHFLPLGVVLVAMLGVGVAEGSGFMGTALRWMILAAPPRMITLVTVFAGVISNAASETGYVVVVPLGAIVFMAVGRHPLAGLAAAFAGVSGGYSANLVLGTIDPLLAGISQEMAHIIDPSYTVNPAANYYFMVASVFLITFAGTWITEKIVERRLGPYQPDAATKAEASDQPLTNKLTPVEKKGLLAAGISMALLAGLVMWGTLPEGAVLRNPVSGSLLDSPFLKGIVAFILVGFLVPGLTYGIVTGKYRSDSDVIDAMSKTISTLGGYIVLTFFAAQFVAYFSWTKIGLIFAVQGAQSLNAIGFTGIPLILAFIFLSAFINLFVGSASAKWAIMAPVFVPMFMLVGYSPELTQLAYRIGDSTTNIITPMMSYFALIVAFGQKYDRRFGIGSIIATMLPYSIGFLLVWSILAVIWISLGLPIGPGSPIHYPAP